MPAPGDAAIAAPYWDAVMLEYSGRPFAVQRM